MSPVPAEYVGQARVFRNRIDAADREAVHAIKAIIDPLRARFLRNPRRHRPEMLVDAARMWRAEVPETGRLACGIAMDRKALVITECRLSTTSLRCNEWGRRRL